MGLFNFSRSPKAIDNLPIVFTVSSLLTEQEPFNLPNKESKYELFLFGVLVGWDIILRNKLITPTSQIMEVKIAFLADKAQEFGVRNDIEFILDLYAKRSKDLYSIIDSRDRAMLLTYMHYILYDNALIVELRKTNIENIDKNEIVKFSNVFWSYYSALVEINQTKLGISGNK